MLIEILLVFEPIYSFIQAMTCEPTSFLELYDDFDYTFFCVKLLYK